MSVVTMREMTTPRRSEPPGISATIHDLLGDKPLDPYRTFAWHAIAGGLLIAITVVWRITGNADSSRASLIADCATWIGAGVLVLGWVPAVRGHIAERTVLVAQGVIIWVLIAIMLCETFIAAMDHRSVKYPIVLVTLAIGYGGRVVSEFATTDRRRARKFTFGALVVGAAIDVAGVVVLLTLS